MTALPKPVILPDDEEDINGILGIDCIKNPLKLVNISPLTKVREIGSVASAQDRSKARLSALKSTPKFPKDDQGIHEEELNASSSSDKETSKREETCRLIDAVEAFNVSSLDFTSFLEGTRPELTRTILRRLMKKYSSKWRL